jgi:nicotinate phosphoribosyltransferase
MAHSWIQSFPTEAEAFSTFARVFPDNTSLLVDTYDTLAGVRLAASIDPPVQAIRIDSGDLGPLATQARAILNQHGRSGVKIIVSSDLDEHLIENLVTSGAPIDAFGVGTELITSRDAPALSLVYKLVELDGQGKIKLSPAKQTYPMAKQVFRRRDRSDRFCGDHVTRADESAQGEPLLLPILQTGQLVADLPSIESIQRHCQAQLASLPDRLRALSAKPDYPITYSDQLEADARRLFRH